MYVNVYIRFNILKNIDIETYFQIISVFLMVILREHFPLTILRFNSIYGKCPK